MNRIGSRCLRSAVAITALGLVLAGSSPVPGAGLDPGRMSASEVKALEERLTDAGCYKAVIDGKPSAALDDAIKACPDQRPILRIETGMHTAPIKNLGVDAACRVLATGSLDKTVRLWSAPEGRLQRGVRLPIGVGDAGKIYAAALSPDGRWLAVGGSSAAWDNEGREHLTVVDLASGEIRRFGQFEDSAEGVAFSPDGRRIAAGLWGQNGVRVIDSATGAELMADRNYGDSVFRVAFGPDGSLFTASYDGRLRRYGPDLRLTAKRAAPDGKQPFGVAVDPSGQRVAVGYNDQTPVSILDARTLTPLGNAQTSDIKNGDLAVIAWSRDGATLLAGGQSEAQFQGQWRRFLRQFDPTGRRRSDAPVSTNTIEDIQRCGEGFVFVAQDPLLGLLSNRGATSILQRAHAVDMRDKLGLKFALSRDASSVRFGLGEGADNPVVFDLAGASLTDSPDVPSGFLPAEVAGLPVTDWQDSYTPKFNGVTIGLEESESSRALAVHPGGSGFVLGTEWTVRSYDASGKARWKQAGPGAAWGVNFSGDGVVLVVACGDGTIRWLRWSDGEELLALFVEPESRKWVVWTPTGYYMASPGAEDLIGWHVNRGWEQEADFFAASQFRAQYNRPDIVRLVLQTRDEAEAVRRANAAAERSVEAKPVAAALPPVATILSPADGARFSGDAVEIVYALRSPSGLVIDKLEVLADGEPVAASGFETTRAPEAKGRVTATLPRKDAVVSLIAHSGDLTSAPVSVKLAYQGPSPSPADLMKPKLYALLVGVARYANPEFDTLRYTAHDATELARALEGQKGGLYADVQTRIVEVPTRENVLDGLYWLERETTSRDLAIVFLAGHGFIDAKQKFWFLTKDADLSRLRTTAISNDDLIDLISSAPGKKVLFLDACHADAATTARTRAAPPDMNKVVNDFSTAGSGLVVYGAATGSEVAIEDAKWNEHGAFTKALIEAIGEGRASLDSAEHKITTDMLDLYIEEHVKEMTGGQQHPVMNRPVLVPDFPIALARP